MKPTNQELRTKTPERKTQNQKPKAKILIVDDEPDVALLMRKKFRRKVKKQEMELLFAQDGQQALDQLAAHEDIDLVLTDINMPRMDGLTLLQKIKEQEHFVKSIVISAYGDLPNIRYAMNLGAFDFLTKPIDFNDLEITINKGLAELQLIKEGVNAQEKLHISELKRQQAEQSQRFKEQFLANMSHEIRTPMNAVMGMTNLLLHQNPRSDQLKHLNIIQQSANNLLVIINDILDVSKIEAGKMTLEEKPFSIAATVQQVINTMQFKAREKDLNLCTNMADDLPKVVIGDPVRLNQILVNLVGNAIKFTNEGEVSIQVNHQTTNLHPIDSPPHLITFIIKDTGIGIAPNKLKTIFSSFSQADSSINRKFGGTGLGLTIVQQLTHLHQGSVKVESKLDKGSVFTVALPYHIAPEGVEAVNTQPIQSNLAHLPTLKNLRILLVEDNVLNQEVALDTLQMTIQDVAIDVAENGRIAIDKLQQSKYDVILMDISMPEMDGYEATTYIREQLPKPLSNSKIIALTASATPAEIQKCFEAGVDDYLAKPFKIKDLQQKIHQLVATDSITLPTSETNSSLSDKQAEGNIPKTIRVADLSFLSSFTNNNLQKMQKYVGIFLKMAPQQLNQLEQHTKDKNWDKVRATAHSLKSQLRYMGVHSLKDAILAIEQQAKAEQEVATIPSLVKKVVRRSEQAMEELEAWMNSSK